MSDPSSPVDTIPPAGASRRGQRVDAALEALGDRLNPLLVKETRQALKSRQFTIWFALLLMACWIATIGGLALIGPSVLFVSAGGYLLRVYYAILSLPLIVVTPFAAYRSLAMEQDDNTRDLLEVSSLSPRQMVNGKLCSAALQAGLFLSAVAPCIAFTYLLRGVDATAIALVLAYAVLASLGLSMLGLLIAAATRQKGSQVALSVVFAGGLFAAVSGLLGLSQYTLALDPGTRSDPSYWALHALALSLYATSFAIAYTATVGMSTFASANRSTPVRIAVLAQHAVFLAWVTGLFAAEPAATQGVLWVIPVIIGYWFVVGAALTGEPQAMSQRVRRSLAQSLVGRTVLSWFSPGPGSGYVFAVSSAATGVLTVVVAGHWFAGRTQGPPAVPWETLLTAVLGVGYLAGYLGAGRIAILGLQRLAPVSMLGCFLVQVLVALAGCSLPYVVETLSDRIRVANYTLLQVPSPVWVFQRMLSTGLSPAQEVATLASVLSIGGALFLVNLAFAGKEARQQRVAAPQRVLEDDLELRPPLGPRVTSPWGDLERSPALDTTPSAVD
jgi:hypothetical protein